MTTDPLQRQLDALPPPPLPSTLWPRLAARRRRQVVARRAGMAMALGLLAVGPLTLLWQGREARLPATAATVAATPADAAPAPDAAVATIDHALQNAYARGASDDEVAPLWEARQRLTRRFAPSSPTDPS